LANKAAAALNISSFLDIYHQNKKLTD